MHYVLDFLNRDVPDTPYIEVLVNDTEVFQTDPINAPKYMGLDKEAYVRAAIDVLR